MTRLGYQIPNFTYPALAAAPMLFVVVYVYVEEKQFIIAFEIVFDTVTSSERRPVSAFLSMIFTVCNLLAFIRKNR